MESRALEHVQQWLEVKRGEKKKKIKGNFPMHFSFVLLLMGVFFFWCSRLFLSPTSKWGHILLFPRFCQNWKKSYFSCNSSLHLWLGHAAHYFFACNFWAVVDDEAELSSQFGYQLNNDLAKLPKPGLASSYISWIPFIFLLISDTFPLQWASLGL